MKFAEFSIGNRAATWMLILVILLGGWLSYDKLGRLEDPEYTVKECVIFTVYPGASARQVESEVTEKIETAVQQLRQLYRVRSLSRPGVSIVRAEMKDRYGKQELPQIWDELRRKITDIRANLPPGVQDPIVNDDFGDVYGQYYALTGDGYDLRQLEEMAEDIRQELLLCEEVGKVSFFGVQRQVVNVEIDRETLAGLGITPKLITQAIYKQNAVVSGGWVPVGTEDWRMEISGAFDDLESIENLMIADPNSGAKIRLKDIASLSIDFYEPANQLLFYNHKPAIGIGVSTVTGGNVMVMGVSLNEKLDELKKRLPVGVEIEPISDQADSVKTAVNGFVINLIEAVMIVLVVLVIFMGLRQGLIIEGILVLTILSTFIWMYLSGIVLQRISLGALIIALGMLVDNAIVVVEGISVKIQQGERKHDAAIQAVKETQWPLLGATIIAILAFAAISLSKDSTGEYLKSLFQVIGISLGMSWILAVTVTPFLCILFLNSKRAGEKEKDLYRNRFFRSYRWILSAAIRLRWMTVGLILGLLGLSLWGFRFVDQNFFANSSMPQFLVSVYLPEGTRIEETRDQMLQIGEFVAEMDGIKSISTFVGQGSMRFMLIYAPELPNAAHGQLLVKVENWKTIDTKIQKLREYLNASVPSASHLIEKFKLGAPGPSIEARIKGPDAEVLYRIADQYMKIMRDHSNLESIRTDWGNQVKTLQFEVSEAKSRTTGVSRSDIAQALEMNRTGFAGGLYREGDNLLPIMFRIPEEDRVDVSGMEELQVWSSRSHRMLPLGQVVDRISVDWDVNAIWHLNRERTMTVFAKQVSGNTAPVFAELKPLIEAVKLPSGYSLEWGGEFENQTKANRQLGANIPAALLGMLFISILLFKSFRHPFIIFSGLPLALIGVVSGLLIFQQSFGFMALLGFLSLSGMLIKNEIVLLEQINLEIVAGKQPLSAVMDAAVSRVRPVCMAALTTVLGMIPLIWDPFFGAMAVTIMGGLTFATLLTLIYVPVLYTIVYRVKGVKNL